MKKTSLLFPFLIAVILVNVLSCDQAPKEAAATSLTEAEKAEYLEKGKAIAGATFTELSSHLQTALTNGGVADALQYCKLNAYPLVDSLSKVHHAQIRRTSLKVRNPADAATDAERAVLEQYAATAAEGQSLQPIVQLEQQEVVFYAPIRVNAFCLQCHGTPGETLAAADYALIQKQYPNDAATGYTEGDLRGMWSIRFKK